MTFICISILGVKTMQSSIIHSTCDLMSSENSLKMLFISAMQKQDEQQNPIAILRN